jgi:glycosyltransferase involved in cell wall biosynthesis
VTLLEAMAAGMAVVSTTVSGIPELIEDKINGFLVPPENTMALADILEQLLTNDGLRRSVASAAIETIRDRFNLDGTVSKLDEWISRETRIAFGRGAPGNRRPRAAG